MAYSNFKINFLIRLFFISATIFLFNYFIFIKLQYASALFFLILLIIQIISLFHFIDKTNRQISRFFDAVKYSDFSQTFIDNKSGKSFAELGNTLNSIIKKFQNERVAREAQAKYLETIVQHIATGLITYKPDGEIDLVNNAAKKMLGLYNIKNIRDLQNNNEKFVKILFNLKSGENRIIKYCLNEEEIQLAVFSTQFNLQNQKYILVAMQNIGQELQANELEAWQKLIRVLTHEIMNSVTPISSLASTIGELIEDKQTKTDQVDDIKNALQTIKKRSQGLLNFVDTYRNLTRLPKPDFQIFQIKDLLSQIKQLMQPKVKDSNIKFSAAVYPQSLELTADPDLIEQVLINLLLNAIQAVSSKKDGRIDLKSFMNKQGRIVIEVSDNGCGIPEEVMEKIFIPFFTTKKEGSGIGLSLSRQIMLLHKGSISAQSVPDDKTIFTLRF